MKLFAHHCNCSVCGVDLCGTPDAEVGETKVYKLGDLSYIELFHSECKDLPLVTRGPAVVTGEGTTADDLRRAAIEKPLRPGEEPRLCAACGYDHRGPLTVWPRRERAAHLVAEKRLGAVEVDTLGVGFRADGSIIVPGEKGDRQ